MSTTAAVSAKHTLIDSLRLCCDLYEKDLKYIPEDKFNATPMGCARSPQDFTAEVIGFNNLCAKTLRGEPSGSSTPEQKAAFVASVSNIGTACNMLVASVESLADAIADMSDEELNEQTSAPWGEPMSKFQLANMASYHIMYHDGQLNYIQSCYGDADSHWG